jgi:hypothetical protein
LRRWCEWNWVLETPSWFSDVRYERVASVLDSVCRKKYHPLSAVLMDKSKTSATRVASVLTLRL